MFSFKIMRIRVEMKKLSHLIVALSLVVMPAAQGKPLSSRKFLYTLLPSNNEYSYISNFTGMTAII